MNHPIPHAQIADDPGSGTELDVSRDRKTERPGKWKVLMHNDDYTTQDFVIDVLVRHFHKAPGEATHIMLQVHTKGVAVAGVYPKDLAETKIHDVTLEARAQGMPLVLSMEEA
ncbi:MAG: ATP-dependent Clp protease adaptor ClpS [Thermoanaerobaculia bacterium]|nr:ATP-dependent Clp protease adaptor ClpS [Thermoanaerobaculia bacterium]